MKAKRGLQDCCNFFRKDEGIFSKASFTEIMDLAIW